MGAGDMRGGGAGGWSRFKDAAPLGAAALAVTAAITGVTLLTDNEAAAPAAPPSSESPASADNPASAEAPRQQIQPGGVPGVAFDQAPAAGARQLDMEIVVKFKDDGKVKDIIDAFWRDEASAREKFEAFKARRPEFANLRLDRVTYSNELVLVHENGATPEQRLQAMRAIAARLKAADDISYAEPNMTAQPGGQ